MAIEKILMDRSASKCELCTAEQNLEVFEVPESPDSTAQSCVLLCDTCRGQITAPDTIDANHWRCLNDSMWSQEPAVQVMAYRMLDKLSGDNGWAHDLKDMMYLEDATRTWAESGLAVDAAHVPTRDCNGTVLEAGDTVTLIKDLVVKGANFTAKRGTAVRGISLTDNPEHIEGRVNGTRIVLVSAYLKKSN